METEPPFMLILSIYFMLIGDTDETDQRLKLLYPSTHERANRLSCMQQLVQQMWRNALLQANDVIF